MNETILLTSLKNIKESDLTFFNGGKEVSSLFNTSAVKIEKDTVEGQIAMLLFSYIEHLIIAKAQGKEASKAALKSYQNHFEQFINKLTVEKDKAVSLKDDALLVIEHFFFNKEAVGLALLLAKLAPLAVLKIASSNEELDAKVFRLFDKNKESIFNQVSLFIRELFQAYLTGLNIDPFSIENNLVDISRPLFLYGEELVIPLDKACYSVDSLKDVLSTKLVRLDKYLTKDINYITAIYLLRGFIVKIRLSL